MTSRQNGALSRTRPKKLQSRQHIQIVREDQVDQVAEFDAGRAPIDTGVEKAEEAVSSFPLSCSFLAWQIFALYLIIAISWHSPFISTSFVFHQC